MYRLNDNDFKEAPLKEAWFKEAKRAREKAYVPYSEFKVGCCLVTDQGQYIHGANIENASYPASICAERSALVGAYSQGITKFEAVVIVTDNKEPSSPCGVCRQVMSELCDLSTYVYMANLDGDYIVMTVDELLPLSFSKGDLK